MAGQDGTQTVDYDALAAKNGALSAPTDNAVDYDALAAKHGALGEQPPDTRSFGQKVYDRVASNFVTALTAMDKTGNAVFDNTSPEHAELKKALQNFTMNRSMQDVEHGLGESLPPVGEYQKEPHKLVGDIITGAILHQAMPEGENVPEGERPVPKSAVAPEAAASEASDPHLARLGRFADLAKKKLKVMGITASDLENAWNGPEAPKPPTPKPPAGFEGAGTYGTPVDQWGTRIPDPTAGIDQKIAEDVRGQAAMQRTKDLTKASSDADAMNRFSNAEKSIAADVKGQAQGQVIKQRLREWSQLDPKAVMQAVNEKGSSAKIDDIQARANEIMDGLTKGPLPKKYKPIQPNQ